VKILHTSDWHLGQYFIHRHRKEEHAHILEALLEIIRAENITILLVSGDIFDTGNPPNYALEQYYNFLRRVLRQTHCRHIIVTGGNHDSPSVLNAPKELLQFLDIRVIGGVERNEQNEVIIEAEFLDLQDENGNSEAVIFAVPYLRDRDLKLSVAGETLAERAEILKNAIRNHYAKGGELAQKYVSKNIPILTMGHLFAAGLRNETGENLESQEAENDIHLGNLGKIEADTFPEIFSYVALGHIHKAQKVNGQDNIRYSGSPISLSFSERLDQKSVVILNYQGADLTEIRQIQLPLVRHLVRFSGTFEKVSQAIVHFKNTDNQSNNTLRTWAEVRLKTENILPNADQKLRELAEKRNIEILKVVIERPVSQTQRLEEMDLEEANIQDVFLEKCKADGITSPTQLQQLNETFIELQSRLVEDENHL